MQSPGIAALLDPAALMRIKSLELRAKVVVQGFLSGLHKSPYHGFSVEFTEYRQYSPGDDPRYLDWKLFARSDRYYIKRFEDETNLRCYLLVDQSRSMGYGSREYTKAQYAATLAATLGYFLSTQRDAVGVATFNEQIAEYLPARYRPGHMRRLMLALERPVAGKGTSLEAPLERIAEIMRKRGVAVLISDLLAPIDRLESKLGALTSQGHEVVLFQTLDPAELAFDFVEPALFEDLESGKQLYVDPQAIQAEYRRRFQIHQTQVSTMCDKLGIEFHPTPTDRPLEHVLADFLRGRATKGRKTRRAVVRPSRGA
jgi:uncharacterized protein (DUF58 family)